MYRCFHCGEDAVVWCSDFSFDECGYDSDGIVQILHCTNCGADIEYRISLQEGDAHGIED